MSTANINIKVDKDLKQAAETLFDDLGLNMTTAITMFLKSAVAHNNIPFDAEGMIPDDQTRAALSEYEEMKNNPEKYKRYGSFDDVIADVLADA